MVRPKQAPLPTPGHRAHRSWPSSTKVATLRQGAARGHCATARACRRDPAALLTSARQEQAGRETSFLFYSNGHPAPVTATAECFQLPHEMEQGNQPPSPPPCPGWAVVGTGTAAIPASVLQCGDSCRAAPPCPSSPRPLLQPSAPWRGGYCLRCPQPPSPVPGAGAMATSTPSTASAAAVPRTRCLGQMGSFPAEQKSTAWLSASSHLPKFIFPVFCL